jgi:lysozyme family protein
MPNYSALIEAQQSRWDSARFNPGMARTAASVARRLCKAKSDYQRVEADTGVPWWVIAVIHEREAAQKWDRSIAQGDRWDRVSTHVPKGRGPFRSWHDAAVDALVNCAPKAARWKDWSPGGALTLLMLYNGLGYERRGLPSPYLWSGTQHYSRGKYVADNQFDPRAVDKQLGCAITLAEMQKLDADVLAIGEGSGRAGLVDDLPENDEAPDDKATAAGPDIKSLVQSKIAWAQGGLLSLFGLNAGDKIDASALEQTLAFVKSPGFILLAAAACVGLTIYWRWRDHGRGAKR